VSSGRAPIVTLYLSPGCHLCDRACAVLEDARGEMDFELTQVDISGDADLEARYREWLPVVEIDGERAFVYHVDPEGLRKRLARTTGAD
jgi:glutaredoxin